MFVCDNVRLRGRPILYVSHDEDGDWQFLCGDDHPEGSADGPAVVCLRDLVDRDPSLNELARLCPLSEAAREAVGTPWRIHDRMEDIVRDNVSEYSCHVMKVETDDDGPGFAYSIGLTKTFDQPELICFGLATETMHSMINEIRDRMAKGDRFTDGQRVSDLIEGYDCVLRKVDRTAYRAYFGYALWFYDGESFEALQIVWPDKRSRYPWDADYSVSPERQPSSWLPTESA